MEKKIYYNNIWDCYKGDFINGKIAGKGFYVWNNRYSYFGYFECGEMHGKVIYKGVKI